MPVKAPQTILIAEDQRDAREVLQLAFSEARISVPIHFVTDGQDAIQYLRGDEPFNDRAKYPFPAMLLLDLKMPRLNGFEVLEWVRFQPALQRLLVVVFTSSDDPRDIDRAYELGANSYLVKPFGFEKLLELVCQLETYWLKLNICPDCGRGAGDRPVRVLIRDSSGRYFRSEDQWTLHADQARNFERSERAIRTLVGMNLSGAEVMVEMEGYLFQLRRAGEDS